MQYTVINSDTGAIFIQQQYRTIEEAEARLVALRAKLGDSYPLAVAIAEEDGKSNKEKTETDNKPMAPTQPLRPKATPRR